MNRKCSKRDGRCISPGTVAGAQEGSADALPSRRCLDTEGLLVPEGPGPAARQRKLAWICQAVQPAGLAANHLQGPVMTIVHVAGPPPSSGALQSSTKFRL